MKYVFNKGRYAQSFSIQVKGRERLVSFDRRRVYMDTGNIATTGITEVEDDIYKLLLENKRFKALIDSEEFVLTEKVTSEDAGEVNAELKAENESLKKALKEAEAKNTNKEAKAEMKAKDEEIKSLKAQIEALTKDKKADSETEGF
mgnify:FL=1